MTQPALPNTGSGATILVVDDEDIVRALVARALREAGYRVIQAQHGAAALALLESGRPELRVAPFFRFQGDSPCSALAKPSPTSRSPA